MVFQINKIIYFRLNYDKNLIEFTRHQVLVRILLKLGWFRHQLEATRPRNKTTPGPPTHQNGLTIMNCFRDR